MVSRCRPYLVAILQKSPFRKPVDLLHAHQLVARLKWNWRKLCKRFSPMRMSRVRRGGCGVSGHQQYWWRRLRDFFCGVLWEDSEWGYRILELKNIWRWSWRYWLHFIYLRWSSKSLHKTLAGCSFLIILITYSNSSRLLSPKYEWSPYSWCGHCYSLSRTSVSPPSLIFLWTS